MRILRAAPFCSILDAAHNLEHCTASANFRGRGWCPNDGRSARPHKETARRTRDYPEEDVHKMDEFFPGAGQFSINLFRRGMCHQQGGAVTTADFEFLLSLQAGHRAGNFFADLSVTSAK